MKTCQSRTNFVLALLSAKIKYALNYFGKALIYLTKLIVLWVKHKVSAGSIQAKEAV